MGKNRGKPPVSASSLKGQPGQSGRGTFLLDPGYASSIAFEREARRVARALFPNAGGYAPVIVDGRERDGVLNDGDTIHILEATTNPGKKKAEADLQKSIELKKSIMRQFPDHNFKIWFVTEKDPTADQMSVAIDARKKARCPVIAMSLNAFGQKLVDAPAYLEARQNYTFGSVRNPNPKVAQGRLSEDQFIPLDMIDVATKATISPDALVTIFKENAGLYLLLGDFGAGKSMTMRHIFYRLRDLYRTGKDSKFPIYLNLRDHIGQDEPSSALYDHGAKIGFTNPETLVRAWRAGFAHLFLDGFDEIASSRFRSDSKGLRTVRKRAMTLVRRFVEEHPSDGAALFISGRENYFGSAAERNQALGIDDRDVTSFTLNEFTNDQVQEYLRKLGLSGEFVPDWLPSRPLIVGYLAVLQILRKDGPDLASMSRAEGWDYVLDRIAAREGRQIEDLGGQTDAVRMFVDRLATRARSTSSGRGPISTKDMVDTFKQIIPSSPDEAAQQLLTRMAGLTVAAEETAAVVATAVDQEDAREFVDNDLVDAARAGDVVRFIHHSYDESLNQLFADPDTLTTMGDLGVEVAVYKLRELSIGQATSALKVAAEQLMAPALAIDIFRVMSLKEIGVLDPTKGRQSVTISDGYFGELELAPGVDMSSVTLRDCMINNLYLDQHGGEILGPRFEGCQIEQVFGAVSYDDLPKDLFDKNTGVASFKSDLETNSEIRQRDLQPSVRVLLTSLRKLFLQAGRGRRENAFYRGLGDNEKVYVADVLALVARHHFAHPHKLGGPIVWIPDRGKMREAMDILYAPQQSQAEIIREVRKL